MARPKCVRCDNHIFNLQDYDPPGFIYKIRILCCSKCGAVVGTTGFTIQESRVDYISAVIEYVAKKLGIRVAPNPT